MRARDTLLGFLLGLMVTAAASAAANNWLTEAMAVRLPQSQIVRHPIDNGKYYLCWTDGQDRYGVAFRRHQLDARLRSIPRAGSVPVTSLLAASAGTPGGTPWTARDEAVCWPG